MPRFAVFVPCHNPIRAQLDFCLRSILRQAQGNGSGYLSLTVVDDCSDNNEQVAAVAGIHGVRYSRTAPWPFPPNSDIGGVPTHNLCIGLGLEQGAEFIQLVHPDDALCDGFYEAIERAVRLAPEVALYATQSIWTDEDLRPLFCLQSHWLREGKFLPLHEGNPLAVAGCVVRASAYQKWGGWNPSLVHTGDWECWARMTTKGGACAIDWPYVCYRQHPQNHTSRLKLTCENLRDYVRMAHVAQDYVTVDWPMFYDYLLRCARLQSAQFQALGEQGKAGRMASDLFALEINEKREKMMTTMKSTLKSTTAS